MVQQTILVVEDEPDIRRLIAAMLTDAGYTTIQADDGTQGLALMAQHPVDLVVLDVTMPGLDGLEVCRRIKADPRTARLPVVVLTIRNQLIDRLIGLQVARADAYLGKPIDRQAFLEAVRALLPVPQLQA